tara:strand:- start:1682 stop:1792 length:111 start_codon:yes stop_codon:yes gene_type:complete
MFEFIVGFACMLFVLDWFHKNANHSEALKEKNKKTL